LRYLARETIPLRNSRRCETANPVRRMSINRQRAKPSPGSVILIFFRGNQPTLLIPPAFAIRSKPANHLYRVIDTQTTTAFILEDDADWDITLPDQLLNISSAIRTFTNTTSPPELYPYGLDWDVLWLGHCGDIFNKSNPTNIGIHDPSMLPVDRLRLVFMDPEFYLDFPPQTRVLHRSAGPVCTFGYAVTLKGAKKLRNWASSTGEAFDVKLNQGCRSGALMCLSVAPEVIHHQRMVGAASLSTGASSRKKVKQVNRFETDTTSSASEFTHRLESDGSIVSPTLNILENKVPVSNRVFTHNILHSARCNWNRNDDELVQCQPTDEEWVDYTT